MRRAFGAALGLLLRWEMWALVGTAVIARMVGSWLWPVLGGSSPQILGAYSYFGLVMLALSCGVLAGSMVLLLPLCRGHRGLDFRFLSRHATVTLAAGAIMMGTQLPLSLASQYVSRMGYGWLEHYMGPVSWIVVDLSVFLGAWYVHGKGEEERGLHPPGPWPSLKAGLVTGVVALWLPGVALRTAIEAFSPWDLPDQQYALVTYAYMLLAAVVPVFFTAWFFGALEDRKVAPA